MRCVSHNILLYREFGQIVFQVQMHVLFTMTTSGFVETARASYNDWHMYYTSTNLELDTFLYKIEIREITQCETIVQRINSAH